MTALYGMDLFDHDGTGYLELQRVDEADEYPDDDAAWQEFVGCLERAQMKLPEHAVALEMAISLLNNWRHPMAAVMRGENP